MRWRGALLALSIGGSIGMPAVAVADVPIEYTTRIEPRFPGVAALGPLAVAGFTGSDGKDFAAALRAELQTTEVEGRAFYTVRTVDDTARIDSVASAIKAAQAAGAAAVFFGGVAKVTIDKADYKQDQSRCTESGILHCSKSETVQLPCTRYTGVYVVTPTLYVAADAKAFYTETLTIQSSYSTCSETQGQTGLDKILGAMTFNRKAAPVVPVTTPEQLLAKLRTDTAAEILSHITPTTKKIRVIFKDQAHDLARADQTQFREAAQFARANRLDRACGIYETLLTPDKANNVALLYNLGVCQEALEPDRPAAALEYYAKADQRTTTPDKLVSEAYLRMKALVDALPPSARR